MISLTKKAVAAAICIAGVNGSNYMNEKEGKAHLKMNKDGKFKILQLTDLHIGENANKDDLTI